MEELLNTPLDEINMFNTDKILDDIKVMEDGIKMIRRKVCDIRETAKALYLDMKPTYERSSNELGIKLHLTVYGHVANGHKDKATKALEKYVKYTDEEKEKLQKYIKNPEIKVKELTVWLFNHETVPIYTKKFTVTCDLLSLMVKDM